MSKIGQPLRFLGWILGGWVAVRTGMVAVPMLWSSAGVEPEPASERSRSGRIAVQSVSPSAPLQEPRRLPILQPSPQALNAGSRERIFAQPTVPSPPPPPPPPVSIAFASNVAMPPSSARPDPASLPVSRPPESQPTPLPRSTVSPSRWSLTGWLLWRREAGASLAQGPLLGGSQAGLRLDYRLWSSRTRQLGLYARTSRALDRPFAEEGAIGIAARPIEGLPVTLMAERRQRLGTGGRSGFAFLAAGGIGPKPIAPRVEIEGYAQAGIVTLPGAAGFADGKLAVGYRLTRREKAPDVALGFGLSGGVQPGASRLDFGPELRLRLPVAGGHMRLSAEWRQRIAGAARPASGPAIALVADF